MNRVLAVAANTFRETVRERVLYGLVFFAVIMTLSGSVLGRLSIRQDEKILKDLGLAAIDLFGTLIAVFVGTGLVSKEIDRRSIFPLLAKPVSRGEFYLGKFCGLSFTLLVNTASMALGLVLTLTVFGHGANLGLLQAIFPLYLGLLVVVALALLLSTLTSSTLAAVGTVGVVLAGRSADVLRNIREVAPGAPGALIDALYYLLPNFQHFDFKNKVAFGEAIPPETLLLVSAYGLVYVAILLLLGAASFARREFQ